MGRTPWLERVVYVVVVLVGLGLVGCQSPLTTGIRIESFDQGTVLSPRVASRAYRPLDRSMAEIFVSDIPLNELRQAESFDELEGTILRVTMFVRPRPGKTPIEPTASTATVQAAVLARGEVGLYGGGGFMLPDGKPGDDAFGGTIRDGSMRLLSSTPGFADRLGASRFYGTFGGPDDAGTSALMGSVFEQAVALAGREPSPRP